MIIRGREIRFLCTVEAHHKISALADDDNIQTVLSIMQSTADTVQMYATAVLFCVALSEGYENNRAWEDPNYTPHPLTVEECNHLVRKDFDAIYTEAINAFLRDIGQTVEAEEPTGKKTEKADGESD